ncbi:unnamed protein product, partial [Mesorhabditis spiculigera]
MTVKNLTILEWLSLARPPVIILHHLICIIYVSRRKTISPIVKVVLVIFLLDLGNLIPGTIHNLMAEFNEQEMFPPFLVSVCVFTQSLRWYGIMVLVCYIAFLHLWSIYDITRFRRIPAKTFNLSLTALMLLSTAQAYPRRDTLRGRSNPH